MEMAALNSLKTSNMKGATIILVTVLTTSLAHPATEERFKTTVTVTARIESTKVTRNDTDGRDSLKAEAHATVKCDYIHPEDGLPGPDNHGACNSHCTTLTTEYDGGECREGVCHCRRELGGGKRAWGADDPHPTVKCVDIVTEDGEERSENDEVCQLHCRSLKNGYKKGECAIGICFCSQQI